MLFNLSGQVAIVTGSSRGIGRAIAEALAAHGAKVVISSRKAEACQPVADAIIERGGEALVVPCNISDPTQLRTLVATTVDTWGRLDCVVCNAAANPYYGPLAEITEEAYDKTLDNNVKSNLLLANQALPHMAKVGGGVLIIVSSIVAFRGSASLGAYTISKAADLGLMRSLAVEWGGRNIRVNCLAPGVIKTDFARALWENPKIRAGVERSTPLGRIGEVEDVAGAAVFLASPASRYITGECLVIDGGATITAGL